MKQIEAWIRQLTTPVTPETEAVCEATAIALGERGEAALPAIRTLLASPNVDVRFWAVRSLWAHGGETASALLIEALSDAAEMVRSGAALALGELKTEAAIPDLIRLMSGDSAPPGDHAADALSKIGPPAAAPLSATLHHERPLARMRAAKALIPLESHAAIRDLIHCLDHDPSYLVRHYADQALKRMGVGEMIYFKSGSAPNR